MEKDIKISIEKALLKHTQVTPAKLEQSTQRHITQYKNWNLIENILCEISSVYGQITVQSI